MGYQVPADIRRAIESERLAAPAGPASLVRTAVISGIYLACALVGLRWQHVLVWLPAWLVMAMILNGAISASHEGVHGNLLRADWANKAVAEYWSLAVLLNFSLYRAYHLEHHRRTRLEGDPEPQTTFSNVLGYLVVFPITGLYSLLQLWFTSAASLAGWFPAYVRTGRQRRNIRLDAVLVLAASGGAVAWGVVDTRSFLIAWAMPMLASSAVFTVTVLPEHYGCARVLDPLRSTRSTRSNALVRYLYWNNNFHAEHHLIPGVPYLRVGRLSELLGDRVPNQARSYTRWHLGLIRELISPDVIDLRDRPGLTEHPAATAAPPSERVPAGQG